ncbi:MAG: VanW family protein [Clostridia bacterium]|nr:VanW family protein [Clostridia bacterium]
MPQFFDAAVGRHSDFVFSNTLPYPIRILATAGNGIINVFIMRAEYDAK